MSHRRSIHPTSVKQAKRLDDFHWVEEQWRHGNGDLGHFPELALALGLIITVAPSKSVLLNTLAAIGPDHWQRRGRVLSIPAEQPVTYARSLHASYDLRVPESLKGPIKQFLEHWPNLSNLPDIRPNPLSLSEYTEWFDRRRQHLDTHLEKAFGRWLRSFADRPKRLSLRVLCQTAPQALVARGMPGQFAFLLQSAPLPTTSITPVSRDDPAADNPGINHASVQSRVNVTKLRVADDDGAFLPDTEMAERDPWKVDSIIKHLRQAREALIKASAGNSRGDVQTILGQAQLDLADIEGVRGSFAELMLLWTAHMVDRRNGPQAASIRTYTNRLLSSALLASPLAFSIADWDTDDVADVIELVSIEHANWAPATFGHFLQTLAFFIGFAQKLGFAEEASVPGAGQGAQASTYRQAVLGPSHIDTAIEHALVYAENATDAAHQKLYEQIALILILAFYGGMRSGEIQTLNLADLIYEQGAPPAFAPETVQAVTGDEPGTTPGASNVDQRLLYINVLRGKTPAARRRIAMHAMMPERWLDTILDVVERRAADSRRRRYELIPLLVPLASGNTRVDPVRSAREFISAFYGSQRDLHSLRHSAASFHFLRIAALRNPALVDRLIDRDHELFAEQSLNRLQRELEWPQGAAIWERGLSEHWLSRTLGHSQMSTTLRTYVHTTSIVHSEWLSRC